MTTNGRFIHLDTMNYPPNILKFNLLKEIILSGYLCFPLSPPVTTGIQMYRNTPLRVSIFK